MYHFIQTKKETFNKKLTQTIIDNYLFKKFNKSYLNSLERTKKSIKMTKMWLV